MYKFFGFCNDLKGEVVYFYFWLECYSKFRSKWDVRENFLLDLEFFEYIFFYGESFIGLNIVVLVLNCCFCFCVGCVLIYIVYMEESDIMIVLELGGNFEISFFFVFFFLVEDCMIM